MATDLNTLKTRMRSHGLVRGGGEQAEFLPLIIAIAACLVLSGCSDDDGNNCSGTCAPGCSPGCQPGCQGGCQGGYMNG